MTDQHPIDGASALNLYLKLVPMPPFSSVGGVAVGGYAFALCNGSPSSRRGKSHEAVPNQVTVKKVSFPTRSTGVLRKRLARHKHFWGLKICRKIVDLPAFVALLRQDNEQGKVNSRIHTLLLWSPCGTEDLLWKNLNVPHRCCFYLGKIPAEIADEIRTFEVWRQLFECSRSFTRRAAAFFCNKVFTPISKVLSGSGHGNPHSLTDSEWMLASVERRLT